jgi:uncharacterized protein with FMN-binding domain
MRRIIIWLASTITIVVLLFGYHTSTNKTSSAAPVNTVSSPTTSTGGRKASSPKTSAGGRKASSPKTSSGGRKPTPSPSSKITTYSGSVAHTRWGPVQVKITVHAGKITKVTILQQPNGSRRDTEINSQALPILIDETVKAQSADIDMVSGATVTSDGYLRSLQAALDEAGI